MNDALGLTEIARLDRGFEGAPAVRRKEPDADGSIE